MKEIYINQLADYVGCSISDTFYVSEIIPNHNKQGTKWMTVQLSDTSGTITAKIWSEFTSEKQLLLEHSVCKVSGTVDIYNGVVGLAIVDMEVDVSLSACDYGKGLEEAQRSHAIARLKEWIEEVSNPSYRALLELVFTEGMISFFGKLPGALRFHHLYNGGLLLHTLEVVEGAVALSNCYPVTNRDLLITGALLHDLGKVRGYYAYPKGGRSVRGKLVGQGVEVAVMIGCYNNLLPKELQFDTTELTHLVLASQEGEGGVRPATKEAIIVATANQISGALDGYDTAFIKEMEKHPGRNVEFVYSKIHETELYGGGEVECGKKS